MAPTSPASTPVPTAVRSPLKSSRRLRPDPASTPDGAGSPFTTPPPAGAKRRSRSPHASPSAFYSADGASEGRVSAAILFIEESMKAMEGRHAAEIQGLQEANLLLRRDLYGVRDDLRDQAAAALTQANAALRYELGQLESKARTLENETFGRIKILEDELKKHEAHLQSSHNAKPEDARILANCFKYLDEQVEKVKATVVQGIGSASVPGPALLGRLAGIEAEIVGLKADLAGAGAEIVGLKADLAVAAAVPTFLRAPPGYSQPQASSWQPQPPETASLNLRGAYAAGGHGAM